MCILNCCSLAVFAQKRVTGTITDVNGEPVIGANVVEKGTTNGSITDQDGNFSLTVPDNALLQVSFIGYVTKDIKVGTQTVIRVTLDEDAQLIGDVVVTALGIKRDKKALGYSVGEVKGDDLTETPQGNLLNALSGKVAGVKINQMNGTAGSSVNMIIRGATSLNNDNQPLFVVDGIPVKNAMNNFYEGADMGNAITDFNPDDIESISVLKGASAAALYGSRAGNGVVLITTKSAGDRKKGMGVSFNTSNMWDVPLDYVDVQNRFASGKDGTLLGEQENESWGVECDTGQEFVQWNTNGEKKPLVSYPNRLKDFFKQALPRPIMWL
jgi:TonB-dependent SusC/RagA subfamily outer membrane receptor